MLNNYVDYKKIICFYSGKRVLLTGHSGFKGTWMTQILLEAGAFVCGYSLGRPTTPDLFSLIDLSQHSKLTHIVGDIRDLEKLKATFYEFRPEIVLHFAAQPIVRISYHDPIETYSTNVMGTVNILECIRLSGPGGILNDGTWGGVQSFLNVTTDKVYKNKEWLYAYREYESLDGFDPYSNSKSCSELVTNAYQNSFFKDNNSVRISTARAGNVIGGGDFAADRIIPDCVRAIYKAYGRQDTNAQISVRNPNSIRPYQHVLEPLFAYLLIAQKQYEDSSFAGNYNVGPDDCDCVTTGQLVDLFCKEWNINCQNMASIPFPHIDWLNSAEENAPHESNFLKLDNSKLKHIFQWQPRWHIEKTIEFTVAFSKIWLENLKSGDNDKIIHEMNREIEAYIS